MLEKEVLNFILQDMPESIIGAMFCFVFLNLRFRWKEIFIIAVLLSFANMAEVMPLAFGIRIIILLVAYAMCIKVFTKKDLSKVFVAVFFFAILSIVGDSLLGMQLMPVTGLKYLQVYNNPYLRALFSYPTLVVNLVVTYLIFRYKKKKMIEFE
ncbi:MAG TPA: hypothetical protein VMW83_04270 [Spirochaetia bacterium]|nr:hypothetical protein [Spirochaetia bacterium]